MIRRDIAWGEGVLANGKGLAVNREILLPEEFCGKGRLFKHIVLQPGCSVGAHKHEGEFEVYYILKGEGSGREHCGTASVRVGVMIYCPSCAMHVIDKTDTEDLEFIAVIVFS